MEKVKVLWVVQHPDEANLLHDLNSHGIDLVRVRSAEQIFQQLSQQDVTAVLIDDRPESQKIIQQIWKTGLWNDLPIICVTKSAVPVFENPPDTAVVDVISVSHLSFLKNKIKVLSELKRKKELLKRSIYELIQLKTAAEDSTRKRNEFLSNMSHEIRTPLSAVIGFSEVISNPNLSEEDRRKVRSAITSHGLQLMRLIDGFLDFSKLESNQLELKIVRFTLHNLLADIQMNLNQKARDKGVGLYFDTSGIPENLSLLGDSHCIRQVLVNIIGNAIKFTKMGDVKVHVRTQREELFSRETFWSTTVVVEDEGTGIEGTFINSLFTPFAQSDSTTRKQFSGTGLGLAISQRMMRLMGGDVRLVSTEASRGSTFEISFRLEQALEQRVIEAPKLVEASKDGAFLSGKSILAVDDSPDNLELLEYVLSGCDVKLVCVTGGHDAYSMVEKNKFDLILMDIQMPLMDGYETTQKIRSHGFNGPIVALTAHVVKHEIEKCYQAGCNAVIGKPYTRGDLFRQISQHL